MSKKHISNLEDHIGYWLRCLSNFVSDSFSQKLQRHEISVAQWVVMRTLYHNSDINLNKAAEIIGVDKSSLSRMIERLVQKNLVNRIDGKDRRSLGLSLTEEGKKIVPELANLADKNDEEFFAVLSKKEKQEFLSTINKLLSASGWKQENRGKDRME